MEGQLNFAGKVVEEEWEDEQTVAVEPEKVEKEKSEKAEKKEGKKEKKKEKE